MKDPAGNAAPAGGFQNGGWYSGHQYWNGSFGAPGVIINPNQQGAGQAVSAGVVAQTNPKNVSYLQQQNPNAAPTNPNPAPATPSAGATSNVGGLFGTPSTSSTLNLPSMYQSLTTAAGIPQLQEKANGIQSQIDQITSAQGQQISTNNENPFLSEANRVGREEKINIDAQNQIGALTNDLNAVNGEIAQNQTNIQNQLGLATQQFQIDDQQHQEALSQFNTLLSSGLLSNLSGSDIANIAASTGLPTDVIQAAMTKSQQADVSPQMITNPNDGSVTMIDANTGNIISQTQIPGWTASSGGTSTTVKGGITEQTAQQSLQGYTWQKDSNGNDISPFMQFVANYANSYTLNEIYKLYENSPYGQKYGTPSENRKQIQAIYDASRSNL